MLVCFHCVCILDIQVFKVGCQEGIPTGQVPTIPPNDNLFSISLLDHVADVIGFLTRDPLLFGTLMYIKSQHSPILLTAYSVVSMLYVSTQINFFHGACFAGITNHSNQGGN